MPTKLRVVLKNRDGSIFRGSYAVAMLCQYIKPKLLDIVWPVGFEKFGKRAKLEFMAQHLPKGAELTLVRERKHTRRNRSLYLQTANATANPVLKKPKARDPFLDLPGQGVVQNVLQQRVQVRAGGRR